MFPPMGVRLLTNKRGDWVKLLEGGIFQYKSRWKTHLKYAKAIKLAPISGNLWSMPSK